MPRFASSVSSLRSSEIRDLMSVAAAPDIISFSGGMPGNDLFPLDSLDDIYRSLTEQRKTGSAAIWSYQRIAIDVGIA